MIVVHDAFPLAGMNSSNNILLAFFHNSPFFISKPPVLVAYTIVPWVAVMLLGYAVGPWFNYSSETRDKLLLRAGAFELILFIALRFLNVYGDPAPWTIQERGSIYTFLSFLNVSKSPPSLLFLSVTLGMACILLVLVNKISMRVKQFFITYGRVPFFYFIVHLAIISLAAYVWTYISFGKSVNLSFENPKNWPTGYEPNLWRVYFVWLLLIIILYFPCRWYGKYKAKSKAWWVSYL
jgi:uncharacterized membrane protein